MRKWKALFSVLTVIFGAIGLMKILPYDTSMPLMFLFLGLVLLVDAKECHRKGAKRDAVVLVGVTIFLYVVTAYNLLSRILGF